VGPTSSAELATQPLPATATGSAAAAGGTSTLSLDAVCAQAPHDSAGVLPAAVAGDELAPTGNASGPSCSDAAAAAAATAATAAAVAAVAVAAAVSQQQQQQAAVLLRPSEMLRRFRETPPLPRELR